MGVESDIGGVFFTVMSARETPRITYVDGDSIEAREGGTFVVLEVDARNRSGAGLDPSCSAEFSVVVKDKDGNEYEQDFDVKKYNLPDNPGCNDIVPNGFDFHTTWSFLVPQGTEIVSAVVTRFDDEEGTYLSPITIPLSFDPN